MKSRFFFSEILQEPKKYGWCFSQPSTARIPLGDFGEQQNQSSHKSTCDLQRHTCWCISPMNLNLNISRKYPHQFHSIHQVNCAIYRDFARFWGLTFGVKNSGASLDDWGSLDFKRVVCRSSSWAESTEAQRDGAFSWISSSFISWMI